jgi:hypothetical protein
MAHRRRRADNFLVRDWQLPVPIADPAARADDALQQAALDFGRRIQRNIGGHAKQCAFQTGLVELMQRQDRRQDKSVLIRRCERRIA